MEPDRSELVAARVVAWHNRHPLARRIRPEQVHSIGVVSLPFAFDGASEPPLLDEPVPQAEPAPPEPEPSPAAAVPDAGPPPADPPTMPEVVIDDFDDDELENLEDQVIDGQGACRCRQGLVLDTLK